MNDPTDVEAARKFAERRRSGWRSRSAPRRPASRAKYRNDGAAAKKLLAVGESPRDATLDAAEVAAWAMVATAILNLDETLNRN